jgi:acyl-CoA synthetase (AMP-forming)/AMP-acid ligase II
MEEWEAVKPEAGSVVTSVDTDVDTDVSHTDGELDAENAAEAADSATGIIRAAAFGAVPMAEIVPRDPANPPKNLELTTLCRRELSSYKVPVRYAMVASIPKTPSGKILRQS